MSVVLWPRQEVLQLVIPQLGTVGRNLNANTALNLIKRLTKFQSSDGKISFDRWLVVAKDILRWNDNCIHLFWDMLSLGTYYLSRESALQCSREEVSMDLEHIAIFLILHINEAPPLPAKPPSPSAHYDSIWPSAAAGANPAEGESDPPAPSSSPKASPVSSPKKLGGEAAGRKMHLSPHSPRSPNHANLSSPTGSNANGSSPQSPKRGGSKSTSTPNGAPVSSPQYLLSVRQKIPIILKALCGDGLEVTASSELSLDDLANDSTSGEMLASGGGGGGAGTAFTVSKKILDALALIICGGYSRDQSVPLLSSLHPLWSSDQDSSMRSSRDGLEGDDQQRVAFSELLEWLNMHLAMNDVIYPPINSSPALPGTGAYSPRGDAAHSSGATAATAAAGLESGAGGLGGSPSAASASPTSSATAAAALGRDGSPTTGSPSSSGESSIDSVAAAAAQSKPQQPARSFAPISSLTRSQPLVITGCCTTQLHVVTSSSSRSSSFRKTNSRSNFSMSSQSYDVAELIRASAAGAKGAGAGAMGSGALRGADALNELSSDSNDQLLEMKAGEKGVITNTNVSPNNSFLLNGGSSITFSNTNSPKGSPKSPAGSKDAPGGSVHFGSVSGPAGNRIRNLSLDSNGSSNDNDFSPRRQLQHGLSDYDMAKSDLSNDMRVRDMSDYGMSHPSSLSRPDQILPQAFLNYCSKAKLYLISPFYSASVTGCVDSEILLGAVFGAVIVSNCQRVSITCTCRKLIVLNCVDCAFNIATLTTTIISGDCKGIVVGPYNASYRNLKNHIKLAALHPLLSSEEPSANFTPAEQNAKATTSDTSTASFSNSPNCWASLCDVVACLEAPPTLSSPPQSGTVDTSDSDAPLLPPLPSTARLLNYEDFKPIAVPYKPEALLFESCPIRMPSDYVDSLQQQLDTITQIKAQIGSLVSSALDKRHSGNYSHVAAAAVSGASGAAAAGAGTGGGGADNPQTEEEKKKRQAMLNARASAAISKKFMEWLVSSGNAKQVLDLIRIDTDKYGAGHHLQIHSHGATNHTPATAATAGSGGGSGGSSSSTSPSAKQH